MTTSATATRRRPGPGSCRPPGHLADHPGQLAGQADLVQRPRPVGGRDRQPGLAALTIRARPSTIINTHAVKVIFTVTDAGDPVQGAKVKVAGHTLTTGKNGTCSLTFARHARPGACRAVAALASYYSASTTVHVKS